MLTLPPTQVGIVHDMTYIALPLVHVLPIYAAELFAIVFAMFYALSLNCTQLHIFSDNQEAIGSTRRFRGYFAPDDFMNIVYLLKRLFERLSVSYIDTMCNPTDYPRRIGLQ